MQADTGRWVCVVERARGVAGLELVPEAGCPPPSIVRAGQVVVVFDGRLTDRRGLVADASASTDAGRTLAVASFVEPLLRYHGVPPDIDPVAAAANVLGLPLRLEETLFTAVRRVPPGHALEVSPAGTRLYRYWDPGEPGGERGLTPREAAERFDMLFRQAVDRCVEAGPAAVFLSGGIDSATVAAVTAEVNRERQLSPPLGLSLMVKHPDLDDEANQRAVAADLGMVLLPVSLDEAVGPGRLFRATLETSASACAAPADIIQPIYDFLARVGLRHGRQTFLNGQGGDEWLLPPRL